MSNFITVVELAKSLSLDRSNLHKRIKKASVQTVIIPVMTDGGIQQCRAVPREFAEELLKLYNLANRNRETCK